MTKEKQLEGVIRTASNLLDSGLLNWTYGNNEKLLKQRRDYWESKRVAAQEQLYNLRNGDHG